MKTSRNKPDCGEKNTSRGDDNVPAPDRGLHVVGSSGSYLACSPGGPDGMASGEFGFELQSGDDGSPSVRLGRLSIDLNKVPFGAVELKRARRDAELILSALDKRGDSLLALIETFKQDPVAANKLAAELGLSETDFQSEGGGLWFLVVVALVIVASGCAGPRPSAPPGVELPEPIETLPAEGETVRPCGYRTQLIRGRITGYGSSRTSPERAARRARENMRANRRLLQEQLQRRFVLKCEPPCRPKMLYWDDGSDASVSGVPGAGGGPLFAVEFDTHGDWSVSIPGPGTSSGGRVYASVTRNFTFQMICEK